MPASRDLADTVGAFPENEGNFRRLLEDYESKLGIVPFIGAGLSIGMGLPGWAGFLISQAKRAGIEEEVSKMIESGLYEEAAESLMSALHAQAFNDAIEDAFGDHRLKDIKLAGPILRIPQLAEGPVITTNFDHLLETAFRQAGRAFERVTWGAPVDLTMKALVQNRRFLIKLHGDVDDSTGRILTLRDYKKNYGSSSRPLLKVVREIFSTRPVLFVGWSLKLSRIGMCSREFFDLLS